MATFLTVLHILVCLLLIAVVLLQRGKGSDLGAALGGGGSNTVFGSRGAGNFLTKITTAAAITFMLTSLSLSYISTQASKVVVFDDEAIEKSAPLGDASALEETGEAVELQEIEIPDDGASADALEEIPQGDDGP